MILKFILTITLACTASLAFAEQIPAPTSKDKRIKSVDYDAKDIVKLYVTKGIMTQIQFAPDEIVPSVQDAIYGESKFWIKWTKDNYYFIKPMEQAEYTNLFIQTNKRNYKFIVQVCKTNCNDKVTYTLMFNYGTSKTKQESEQGEQEKAGNLLKTTRTAYKNYQYVAKGNHDIRPIDAYDNGKYTYLIFPNQKSIPIVYTITDAKEVLTNSHIENKSTLVIHQLSQDFILRLGSKVLAVRNQNYDKTTDNSLTSTISPLVERQINDR